MSKENSLKAIKLKYGSVYQKEKGGNYYFRYQLPGDKRKAVSLKTKNLREAKKLAETYIPIIEAPSPEVVAAHVNHAKFGIRKRSLPLSGVWTLYSQHPERAMPATVSEEDAYRFTWREFCEFMKNDIQVSKVTSQHAQAYADHMRTVAQSVETHNRKLRRLKRIFKTLNEYTLANNPFNSSVLRRKLREEQNTDVRRLAFSKEHENKIIEVLEDSKYKVKNKSEIRILYFLGMFTGQRLKDCALLKWSRVDLRKKRIWVKQFKTGKEVTIPIAEELLKVLKEIDRSKKSEFVLPAVSKRYLQFDERGKNTGATLVNIDVLRVIKWIGLESSVKVEGRARKVTVYGFHSLRHSFASHCAEAGVPKAVVVSILGANSDVIDLHYTHIGEEAQLKAMEAISLNLGENQSYEERVKAALVLIDGNVDKTSFIVQLEKVLKGCE